jgi:hypothetical protein
MTGTLESPKRISDIGTELNAGTMIEESVRKASNGSYNPVWPVHLEDTPAIFL